MGLLSKGSPLTWEEIRSWCEHVRHHAAMQFLFMCRKGSASSDSVKFRSESRELRWGDEIEYSLVYYCNKRDEINNDENGKVTLLLTAHDILAELNKQEVEEGPSPIPHAGHGPHHVEPHPLHFPPVSASSKLSDYSSWHPEFADYMLEGIPKYPYGSSVTYCNTVEANLSSRRRRVKSLLPDNCSIVTMTSFPRLGCPDFTSPPTCVTPCRGYGHSLFFPDRAISRDNAKFLVVTRHVREQLGHVPHINIPVYRDTSTPWPFEESAVREAGIEAALPNHIYGDCLGFGGGSCCLQVTLQAADLREARYLYDQLAVVCPIILALSGSTPCFKGYLTDLDTRWRVFRQAADVRSDEEKLEPSNGEVASRHGSRCDAVDLFVSSSGQIYNDVEVTYSQHVLDLMRNHGKSLGVDEALAKHVAHVLSWDPLFLLSGEIHQRDEIDNEHFENLQSTYWQSMRLKPPPQSCPHMGWRVEFRPCDLQITDVENAAFITFIMLLSRTLISSQINLLMPMSKVIQNMDTAELRDSVRNGKFWFRLGDHLSMSSCKDVFHRMSIADIMCGCDGVFPGLIPLVRQYLTTVELDTDTSYTLHQYLELLEGRAKGELPTGATWIRNFIRSHPSYCEDSVISDVIAHDLVHAMDALAMYSTQIDGETTCEDDGKLRNHHLQLLGGLRTRTRLDVPERVAREDADKHSKLNAHIEHVQSCIF